MSEAWPGGSSSYQMTQHRTLEAGGQQGSGGSKVVFQKQKAGGVQCGHGEGGGGDLVFTLSIATSL